MRGTPILLACAAFACVHAPPPPPPKLAVKQAGRGPLVELPPSILHERARTLMAEGKWEQAWEKLEAYLAREPGDAAALFEAGWMAEKRSDPAGAKELYRRSLEIDPGQVGAALDLARLLQDDPVRAEAVLRASLEKLPGDPRLLDGLAAALLAQKKLDEAAAAARQVLERHPDDAGAFRALADVEAGRGRIRHAEWLLENARKLDPADAGTLNSLGLLALRRDDPAAARADFAEAARLDPSFAPAWANLGALALRYRDYAAAEQACGRSLELDPGRWETRLSLAQALEGLQKPAEARAEYERVLAARPDEDDALYGRALALRAEGSLEAAAAAFQQYLPHAQGTRAHQVRAQIAAIELRMRTAQAAPAGHPGGVR
ncbi:MAG TPA: tetratricopeptide repeat protein [Myxococcales bacterium]|nr:tetratricopeptide repeat protein [Myxococcales bacterium]